MESSQGFSLSVSRLQKLSPQMLREEVHGHTRNDTETSRIMSAMERFGADPSIEEFEMIPSRSRTVGGTTVQWTVRARRSVVTRPLVRPWGA